MSAGSDSVAGVLERGTWRAPWRAGAYPEGSEFEVIDADDEYVCGVNLDGYDYSEAQRIARLIAAAPELLEALENARDAIREMRLADAHANRTGEEVRFDRAFAALLNLQKPINAAIAKARSPQ